MVPFVLLQVPPTLIEDQKDNDKTVRNNKDKLYYNTRERIKYCLLFGSIKADEWIGEMKKQYKTDFEEIRDDNGIRLKFKSGNGTISIYPFVKVVVHGKIIDKFEDDFDEMRNSVLHGSDHNLAETLKTVKLDEDTPST